MLKRKKILKFIKIHKTYQEKMTESEEEILAYSSGEQKEEEYSWTKDLTKKGLLLKKYYLKYPFMDWDKIIKEKLDLKNYDQNDIYQETVNIILEVEVFKTEDFKGEIRGKNLFKEFMEKLNINKKEIIELEPEKIKPDFYVVNITKESFKSIITNQYYMFRYDKKFNKIGKDITHINIIGEIKTNPDGINSLQKQKYFKFCNEMNSKVKNVYFFTLYIFNISYEKFWYRKFHKDNPCILGYIPKLYSNEYLNIYNLLKNNLLEEEKITSEFEANTILDNDKRNNMEIEVRENIETKINPLKEEYIYDNMDIKELLNKKREAEDNILSLKRDIEDKKEEKKKKLKILKRNFEDSLLNIKRKKEDEEIKLKKITKLLGKKMEEYND